MAASREDPPPGELDDLFSLVDRLPFLGTLKKELTHLRTLLYDRRTPRLLVIGAQGSGRTSLCNALMRAPALPLGTSALNPPDAWVRIDATGRHLEWLEMESGPLGEDRKAALRRALDEARPDIAVLVAAAVDAETEGQRAAETLKELKAILAETRSASALAVIGVATQVDRLAEPEATETGPRFRTEDLAKFDSATWSLKQAIERVLEDKVERPIPVLAGAARPVSAKDKGEQEDERLLKWNVEELAEAIYEALPEATQVEAARALAVPLSVRRQLARTIVNHCSAAAVTVGLMPIPFSDAVLLLPLQGVMVSAVAYVAGQPWDRRAAFEWLGSVGVMGGAAFALRWGAQQLVKLIPGAGTLVSGSVAGAGTLAIGRSAVAYFIDGPGRRELLLLPSEAKPLPPATEI